MKLNTLEASKVHRCIVYGAPKTGKSLLAAKLAEYYNLLWFDLENGYETLFQLPTSWQERIELVRLPDTRSYPIAMETCLKVVKGNPCDICEEHGKVSCMICKRSEAPTVHVDLSSLGSDSVVVFDSSTQLTNSAIAWIIKNQPDDYKMDFDDWGNLGKLMDIFFSHLQQANYNCIVISHEAEVKVTGGSKTTLVPVGGSSNFSRNVAKYFDHVIYCERKNKKHIFTSSSTAATNILTGSRTDVALEEIGEQSLLPIFKPELYPDSHQPAATPTKTTGGNGAQSVLARLKSSK